MVEPVRNTPAPLLLKENRSISQIKPSQLTQNKILLAIHRIFQRILNWLFPFARTNYVGIVAALDRTAETRDNPLTRGELLSYFRRFLGAETTASPALTQCVDQLQEQYQAFDAPPQDKDKAKKTPFDGWVKKTEQLREGEHSLILGNASRGDELFYLISRKEGQLSLKIIGRGKSIAELAGGDEKQKRIVASLDCGAVDSSFVKDVMNCSPLGNKTTAHLKTLLQGRLPVEQDLSRALETKTENVFWTALQQVYVAKTDSKPDFQRTKLRFDLYTLFNLLKEYRHTLATHPVEIETLSRMLHICARNLAAVHEAGIVSKSEVDELVKELTLVQKAIDVANLSTKTPISSLKMASMGIYPPRPLTTLTLPVAVTLPSLRSVENPRLPDLAPPKEKGIDLVRQPAKDTQAVLPIAEQLQSLIQEKATPQKIVQTLYAMKFFPYKAEDRYPSEKGADPESPWVKISPHQAKEIMGSLNTLSRRLVDYSLQEKELPIDMYEVLVKMSYMVAFLNHHTLNRGVVSPESYKLISKILNFGEKVSSRFHHDKNRYGHGIHPANVDTNEQMYVFYWKMLGLRSPSNYAEPDLSKRIDGLTHLQEQVDFLTHLMPRQPYSSNEMGSLGASLHGWIAPLPLPLLAVYHTMGVKIADSVFDSRVMMHNCNTPEAIQHDPHRVLRQFEKDLMENDVAKWRKNVEEELAETGPHGHYHSDDALLTDSPFAGEKRKEQLKALLKKQEEYIQRASQMGVKFSPAELSALLSLLRIEKPQSEVIAFMKTYPRLLLNPATRSFIQLLFFHPSLINALEGDYADTRYSTEWERTNMNFRKIPYGGVFCRLLPRFLAEQIAASKKKVEGDSSEIPVLLYLIQMSERLKGIYQVLGSKAKSEKAHKYAIDKDFAVIGDEILPFLQTQRAKDPSSPASIEVIALQLKILLAKPQLSQDELCQVILDMHRLTRSAHRVSAFDYRELFWIKGSYQELLREMGNQLDAKHLHHVLDTLCHENKLLLDASPWQGEFPQFKNGQYSIDLITGTVKDLASEAIATTLPGGLMTDSLFQKSFPELLKGDVRAMRSSIDGITNVYFFEDLQKNPCRVEERHGLYSIYRSFPKDGHPEWLQAASFAPADPKKEEVPVPALLQQRFFVDPATPSKGYIISPAGEIQLEVALEKTRAGTKMTGVIDLRGGNRSEPMQLVGLKEMNHPALNALEQIEDPAHILVWGKDGTMWKSGAVEKIELPRYGLQFILKGGTLVCTNPQYAGYEVRLSASLEERKGFAFSLLLEHSDRTRPKKLLLPPAHAIAFGTASEPPHSGLAYVIWFIKTYLCLLFCKSQPSAFASPHLHIEANDETLSPVCIDLRPHTEEFAYTLGKEREQSQQMILQLLKQGDYERAIEVIKPLKVEKESREIKKWIEFLKDLSVEGEAAAVGLKIAAKIFEQVNGEKKYKEQAVVLNQNEMALLKAYLEGEKHLTAPLRISAETKKRIETPLLEEDETAPEKPSKTESLEKQVPLKKEVARESLGKDFSLTAAPRPLLFDQPLNAEQTELLTKIVRPKRQQLEKEKAQAKEALQRLLTTSSDPVEQLAIYAKTKSIAQFSDLHLALLQKDFEGLQKEGLLPQGINLESLKTAVIHFYDLEVQLNLTIRSETELSAMLAQKEQLAPPIWAAKLTALVEQLNYRRQYSLQDHPELLAFEAFHFLTFRNGAHPSQLELLQQLLKTVAGITQAGTGTGKSSVLSVLRALMRANGENLVTQKVLPHLYPEALAILQERFGSTFKRKVYPFLFNQAMPLSDKAGNSLFEQIYQNLLEIIRNKGCVLTDYKSFVLLEQKFISLSKQMLASRNDGVPTPPILTTHWIYLGKILTLLKRREDQLMDEFDQPMSAIQRIQTQLREGPLFERWMIDDSLFLYEFLAKDPELRLEQNLQGDVSPEVRQKSIERAAQGIAKTMQKGSATPDLIAQYLTGKNNKVLAHIDTWSAAEKGRLAFLKDQCTSYLPLTLDRASSSNYARSADGKKIITCSKGEKREAKFGNPVEEINYSIQDYLQNKVALPTLREWILEARKDCCADPEGAQARFHDVLPGISLAKLTYLNADDLEDQIEKLLVRVNQDPNAVQYFLRRHLHSLRTSGIVVSMNPQDTVAMSCAVSGVSATTGSLGSLHEQFTTDSSAAQTIQSEMLTRLRGRSLGAPIRYNPLSPLAVLNQVKDPRFCAIIDGSGAFRSIPPKTVAQALFLTNPSLKRVDFYDKEGKMCSIGDLNASLAERGFYFPEAQTRGSDQVLRPDGVALQTATGKGSLEDFIQEEGRMRHPNQRVLVALSEFAPPALKSLEDLIQHKKGNEKAEHAEDRYLAEAQRLRHKMRHAARQHLLNSIDFTLPEKLLQKVTLKPFLDRFAELEPLFVQAVSAQEISPDQYFEAHKNLVQQNKDPVEQLHIFRDSLIEQCKRLHIPPGTLSAYDPAPLRSHLPEQVLPLAVAEQQQQQVQEELEQENQIATEQETEEQRGQEVSPNKVESYLPRARTNGKTIPVSQLHPILQGRIDPRIEFTHPYYPWDRTAELHKRKLFDDRTSPISKLRVACSLGKQITKILIEDSLGDLEGTNDQAKDSYSIEGLSFRYDLRAAQIMEYAFSGADALTQTADFTHLIAQIKFLDGRVDGYTDDELKALEQWLKGQKAAEMANFFETTILKYRPETRFKHSQLDRHFRKVKSER